MTNTIQFFIILFAIMFFFIYNVPAFASGVTMRCFDDGKGLQRCIKPDGTMITIIKG